MVGTGGAAALLLAARRQRSTEIALQQKDRDQEHERRVAQDAREDAAERRITELYTKAADQLGSTQAPVRLAGLYALERLAQNIPDQRQTFVNVLCAYLRVPFTPSDTSLTDGADEKLVIVHREQLQEREIRITAQRILRDHLRPGQDADHPAATFWADIALDLTGATLINFKFNDCSPHDAIFWNATFLGWADFDSTRFTGHANFDSATFTDYADFDSTSFFNDANFDSANFTSTASFKSATFTTSADFRLAAFTSFADFRSVTFTKTTDFRSAKFAGTADFKLATFANHTDFQSAKFARGIPMEVKRFQSPPPDFPANAATTQ